MSDDETRALGTSRHSGALSLFDREFVRAGPFRREHSRALHELFDLRQRADYREMIVVSSRRARSAVAAAAAFVADAREYLDGPSGSPTP